MVKNKRHWIVSLILLGLFGILLVNQGCNGKIPPMAAVLKSPTPPSIYLISDFESGTTSVNRYLPEWNPQMVWRSTTYGGTAAAPNTVNGTFVVPNTVPDTANNSKFAVHIFCSLLATGIGNGYESDQLICPLYDAPNHTYFNASAFTGVRFLINITAADTNTAPVFQVAVDQSEPPPSLQGAAGGICLNGNQCNDHFQADLTPLGPSPVIPGSGWQPVTLTWTNLVSKFGTLSGSNVSGHLDKIIFLQWSFSNNVAGSIPPVVTNTDYWVDNVEFLP